MLLGENFFPLLILAFGAALAIGTLLGLIKGEKPDEPENSDTKLGPLTITFEQSLKIRAVVFIVIGVLMSVWALASLQ